jgi:hypothetical protein
MLVRSLAMGTLGLLVLASARPRAARACAACGCGDATLTAMGQEKPFKNRVRLALEERLGAHSMGLYPEQSLVSRTSLAASWSPLAVLTLGALVPLVVVRTTAPSEPVRDVVGLGDAELMVRALVYRDRRFSPRHLIGLLAGLKMPTGPRVNDTSGYPAPDDVQPGSGSWDPMVGASYAHFGQYASAYVSASYRHATAGYQGYQRGSVLGASLVAQLSVNRKSAIVIGSDLSYTTPSFLGGGARVPDTGGFLMSLSPGLLFALRTDWLLRLTMQVPVIQRWIGHQYETTSAVVSLVVDI